MVTRPSSLHTGMANRSVAISERREARERRRENMARERAAKLAREEEERLKAEQEAREALVQQKKEERRLAKLVGGSECAEQVVCCVEASVAVQCEGLRFLYNKASEARFCSITNCGVDFDGLK